MELATKAITHEATDRSAYSKLRELAKLHGFTQTSIFKREGKYVVYVLEEWDGKKLPEMLTPLQSSIAKCLEAHDGSGD